MVIYFSDDITFFFQKLEVYLYCTKMQHIKSMISQLKKINKTRITTHNAECDSIILHNRWDSPSSPLFSYPFLLISISVLFSLSLSFLCSGIVYCVSIGKRPCDFVNVQQAITCFSFPGLVP